MRWGIMLGGMAVAMMAIVATGVGAVWAERSGSESEQQKLAEAGRVLVKEKCARCHATGMDDKSPHEKAPPFRDVVERYPSENLAEALAEGIVSGHPDMPVFIFEPNQIEGFIAYLDSLAPVQTSPAQSAPPPPTQQQPGAGVGK